MNAVIMAGGEGSRLRPLTCDLPKPMAPLCGRPMIEYILELLARHGVKNAALTVRYLAEAMKNHFADGSYQDIELEFCEETEPLGTAGSVKNACRGFSEDFLVISGDALCDFDLTDIYRTHIRNRADVTIVVKRVEDPREYGLVDFDQNGRITGFLEKPAWPQAATDTANTGVYILNPRVMERVPQGREWDFAKDLFPALLRDGMKLFAYETRSYWCDIGDLDTYVSCQFDMLSGRVDCRIGGSGGEKGLVWAGERPKGDFLLTPPAYIGKNVTISKNASIGPNVVIGDGVTIGENTKIKDSVVLNDGFLSQRCTVNGALLCRGVSLKPGVQMFEGSAAGFGCRIGAGARVEQQVKIWPEKTVADGAFVTENLKYGTARAGLFDDDGICGEAGVDMIPEFCAKIGAAMGSTPWCSRLAVGYDYSPAAQILAKALAAGAASAGSAVYEFGRHVLSEFRYLHSFCGVNTGVYVSGSRRVALIPMTAYGLSLSREMERTIEKNYFSGEFKRCKPEEISEPFDMTGTASLYRTQLVRLCNAGLLNMQVQVKPVCHAASQMLITTLKKLGCTVNEGKGPVFILTGDGTRLSVYHPDTGFVSAEKVMVLCAVWEFKAGRDISVPADFPACLEDCARPYRRKVYRFLGCPVTDSDKSAREHFQASLWALDGIMMAVKLLSHMKENGLTLEEMLTELPEFYTLVRSVSTQLNPGRVLRCISSGGVRPDAEGVMLTRDRGTILVRPLKKGGGLRYIVEAANFEAAKELCDGFERELTDKLK